MLSQTIAWTRNEGQKRKWIDCGLVADVVVTGTVVVVAVVVRQKASRIKFHGLWPPLRIQMDTLNVDHDRTPLGQHVLVQTQLFDAAARHNRDHAVLAQGFLVLSCVVVKMKQVSVSFSEQPSQKSWKTKTITCTLPVDWLRRVAVWRVVREEEYRIRYKHSSPWWEKRQFPPLVPLHCTIGRHE